MFTSTISRIFLAIFVIIIIGIPVGAYFLSQKQEGVETPGLDNSPPKTITQTPSAKPSGEAAKSLANSSSSSKPGSSAAPSASPTSATSFGPTMDFTVSLEGRPTTYQVAKMFVGIAAGEKVVKPTYLLIFSVDIPGDGKYSGLSLAGLTAGSLYTAYFKGPVQIDSAVTFTMAAATTSLNGGIPIKLLTGDLNEDNVINSADFSIASSSFGANENSANWKVTVDFNRDGVINAIDISFIIKNFGKAGDSGPVTSTVGTASGSAQLKIAPSPVGGPDAEATSSVMPANPPTQKRGYWLWVPEI